MLHSCIKGFLRAKKLWVNPPKAERAKPSLSSDYNLLFKNKIGERSLDIHRVPAAIKELDKIELVRINQGRYQLDHAITKNQEEILRAFGLTKNHVMARASSISEMIASSENTSFTEETDDDEEDGDEDLYMAEVYDAEE